MRRGNLTSNKKLVSRRNYIRSTHDVVWKWWKEMAVVRDVECDMTGEEWLGTVLVE